jgi:hypothetical protein
MTNNTDRNGWPTWLVLFGVACCSLSGTKEVYVATCGTVAHSFFGSVEISDRAAAAQEPCFIAEEVIEYCIPVYINLNIHLFVPDSGIGAVQQLGVTQREAYATIERFVENANRDLEQTPQQWPQCGISKRVCVPYRYVLRGIYMHRKNNAKINYYDIVQYQKDWAVRPQTDINIYVGDYPGQSSGIANTFGGTFGGIENLSGGNFNHEIGHLLSLRHTETNDDCSDTYNNSRNLTWGDARNITCWEPASDTQDKNKNGTPDCAESPRHPCCGWDHINNNLMCGSTKFQEALTEQQLLRAMHHMARYKCGYVARVGGLTPPPNAFISQTIEPHKGGDWLILSASVHDVRHHFRITTGSPDDDTRVIYDTGWLNQPAQDVWFDTTDPGTDTDAVLLQSGATYTAWLVVENADYERDTCVYSFKAP